MKFRNIFLVGFLGVIIIFLGEITSFFYLKTNNEEKPFLINGNTINTGKSKSFSYDVIDPLLGWAGNCLDWDCACGSIILTTDFFNENKCFNIYVSGGSTTDLVYDRNNWPIYFVELLNENKICAKVYVSAVSGYSSGQELLKLIRDLNCTNLDVHISYSGANEIENSKYVSDFEENIFNNFLITKSSLFCPNLVYFFQKQLAKRNTQTSLYYETPQLPEVYWETNMQLMYGISLVRNHHFMGVLQPVKGFGGEPKDEVFNKERYYNHWVQNQDFYPKAINKLQKHSYLFDYTNLFKNEVENPFLDDCHLNNTKFQIMVANQIFTDLKNYISE